MKTENTSKISKAGVAIRRRPLVRFYPQNDDADDLFVSEQHWLGLELSFAKGYMLDSVVTRYPAKERGIEYERRRGKMRHFLRIS